MDQAMQEAVAAIRALDEKGALSPYLEANAAELATAKDAIPSDATIRDWRQEAGLSSEADQELLALAAAIRADRTLSLLYFHCSRLAFELMGQYAHGDIFKWPSFEPLVPGRNGLFLLLVALSGVPRIRLLHRMMGVAPEITRDTCSDIASRVLIAREFRNGELGISLVCLWWLRFHVRGELFQLGRLQFHPTILQEPWRVYRRVADGEVLILAEPGQRFTPEGFFDGAGGKLHSEAWISSWREERGRLTAHRVLANGRVGREPVTIELAQWRLVADAASVVMNTHIPRGSRISLADWRSAIARGFEFFRKVRTVGAQPVACACKSWMFDPRLQELLPADSGLVRLQRCVSVFPLCSSNARCGLYFIFGDDNVDLERAPRDTSLRRAVIDFLKAGGALAGGGMLAFEDQLGRFGE